MCHQKKAARRAARQAQRAGRPVRPIVVYERRPGLIRMIVEHLIQSRQEKRGALPYATAPHSTLEPVPAQIPQTRGVIEQQYGIEKVELESPTNRAIEMRAHELLESTKLPSYGEAMKA